MKKVGILLLCMVALIGCSGSTEDPRESFYIGTYTNAESKGIYKAWLTQEGKFDTVQLAAKTENPSFLAYNANKQFLVAVNEATKDGEGGISSFAIAKDSLTFINQIPSYGANPCHVMLTENDFVLTSNYTGGNVVLSKLNSKGLLRFLDSAKHIGKTEHPRQEKPHVHSTWIHPATGDLIAVDLGTNELWFYTIDEKTQKLKAKPRQKLAMDSVAGPRHLTFHPKQPNWMYVLNELNATVSLVTYENNQYTIQSSIGTLPEDYTGYIASADIHISNDGKFLYASNRGYNSIAVFSINAGNGALTLVEIKKVPGAWPRNFALNKNNQYLLVANKWTNNIFSFKRDTEKGTLNLTDSIQVPNPVMILF